MPLVAREEGSLRSDEKVVVKEEKWWLKEGFGLVARGEKRLG